MLYEQEGLKGLHGRFRCLNSLLRTAAPDCLSRLTIIVQFDFKNYEFESPAFGTATMSSLFKDVDDELSRFASRRRAHAGSSNAVQKEDLELSVSVTVGEVALEDQPEVEEQLKRALRFVGAKAASFKMQMREQGFEDDVDSECYADTDSPFA